METALVVALVAGAVALVSAVGNIWSSVRNTERNNQNARRIEALRVEHETRKNADAKRREVSKYSEPLARAAYDLQSRIFNILEQHFAEAYFINGIDREKTYVIENTTFVISQFLCWTEQIRRDIQFIDLDESAKSLELFRLQDSSYNLWGTDLYPPLFRLFAGEQRAIGEALIQTGPAGSECIGYGKFLQSFPAGSNALIDQVRGDVRSLATGLPQARDRLTLLQHALVDLLDLLDPQHIRFPSDRRTKL